MSAHHESICRKHYDYYKKCAYCDFTSFCGRMKQREAYTEAVCREMREQAAFFGARRVNTVFFGGGTPTLMTGAQMERMMDILRRTYSLYGFTPLDTPVIEAAEVLLAKGGGETEKQIYRFNKGDADLALRFDLTVPLAKYVALHYNDLSFPFRRYQIGKVYRGERAQRGRFREFYQADIDVIGDGKLDITNEAEIPSIIYQTFSTLGLKRFQIRVNNRKILNGFYAMLGLTEKSADVMRTVDKLDKIGADGVKKELLEKEFDAAAVEALDEFLRAGDFSLDAVTARVGDETLTADLRYVIATAEKIANGRYGIAYAPSLVRGQGYYTGMVFEVTCPQFSGAVAGGGRYDNMVGKFIGQQVPAVGFSIGFERVCGILLEQDYQIPGAKQKLALLYLKDADFAAVLAKADALRAAYDVTVLPQAKKLGKQFGTLEAAGYNAVAFADNDDIKVLGQKAE